MLNLLHFCFVVIALLIIIFSCTLFTNAVEHLGKRLNLGNNATGSILAVIGTTLPETIVPLVAIFGAMILKTDISIGRDIALGAIIGSPFMLSTFALFVLGIAVIFRKNKFLELNIKDVIRNYKYLIIAYILALIAGFISNENIKLIIVLILVFLYLIFVFRTLAESNGNDNKGELEELFFAKILKGKVTVNLFIIIFQLISSLLFLTLFSHYFVNEIKYFSHILNLNPMILSLIITPFATELPECVNSIIWAKDKKDDLAIANITGAIVFQSTILFSIGILLTSWNFEIHTILNMILVLICSFIFLFYSIIRKRLSVKILLFCGIFYLSYIVYIVIK